MTTTLRIQAAIVCPVDGAAERAAWVDLDRKAWASFRCGHYFELMTCRACGDDSLLTTPSAAFWCQTCRAWRVAR